MFGESFQSHLKPFEYHMDPQAPDIEDREHPSVRIGVMVLQQNHVGSIRSHDGRMALAGNHVTSMGLHGGRMPHPKDCVAPHAPARCMHSLSKLRSPPFSCPMRPPCARMSVNMVGHYKMAKPGLRKGSLAPIQLHKPPLPNPIWRRFFQA